MDFLKKNRYKTCILYEVDFDDKLATRLRLPVADRRLLILVVRKSPVISSWPYTFLHSNHKLQGIEAKDNISVIFCICDRFCASSSSSHNRKNIQNIPRSAEEKSGYVSVFDFDKCSVEHWKCNDIPALLWNYFRLIDVHEGSLGGNYTFDISAEITLSIYLCKDRKILLYCWYHTK